MPRILLVAATAHEVASLRPMVPDVPGRSVEWLITGVGMVATAARCAQALTRSQYDLALNVGLCGTFDSSIALGAVVHVVRDGVAELGAEDGDQFVRLSDLHLGDAGVTGEELVNAFPPTCEPLERLPRVSGITVNTVHGSDSSIAAVVRRWHPQVESMEGAAFMYACLVSGVPFAQVRGVSNRVERRNRAAWTIDEALSNLAVTAAEILRAQ